MDTLSKAKKTRGIVERVLSFETMVAGGEKHNNKASKADQIRRGRQIETKRRGEAPKEGKRSRVVAVVDLNHDTRQTHGLHAHPLHHPHTLPTFHPSAAKNFPYLTPHPTIVKTRGTCPSRAHLLVKADV